MRFFLLTVLVIFSVCLSASESLKIAFVNVDRIMSESKDAQDAQKILDNDRQNWLSQANDMKQEIARLQSEYDSRKMILSDSGKKEAEQKISDKQQELKDFLQDIFGDTGRLAEKNSQLMQPIIAKFNEAVEKVSIDNGYDMVLTSDALVYTKENLGLDITDLVLDEMNALGANLDQTGTGTGSGTGTGTGTGTDTGTGTGTGTGK